MNKPDIWKAAGDMLMWWADQVKTGATIDMYILNDEFFKRWPQASHCDAIEVAHVMSEALGYIAKPTMH